LLPQPKRPESYAQNRNYSARFSRRMTPDAAEEVRRRLGGFGKRTPSFCKTMPFFFENEGLLFEKRRSSFPKRAEKGKNRHFGQNVAAPRNGR